MSDRQSRRKPQWFSTAIALATNNSPSIKCDPFPTNLRSVIEPHIRKARERRQYAVTSISNMNEDDVKSSNCEETILNFRKGRMSKEGKFDFDVKAHPLRESLLQAFKLKQTFDLTQLHQDPCLKQTVFHSLTTQPKSRIQFQETYDHFVRTVCAPHLASLHDVDESSTCTEIYYQAFPCIRIVQPNEFSIGPHADVMYGHHPCSVNYYLPLTSIGGTSSLFLESAPDKEDWHPIVGNYGTCVKHFAGGMNLHFTVENCTGSTRVSLDFRLIPGTLFESFDFKESQFVKREGYYSKCRLRQKIGHTDEGTQWERVGNLLKPDGRVGYPWTVKEWNKILNKE